MWMVKIIQLKRNDKERLGFWRGMKRMKIPRLRSGYGNYIKTDEMNASGGHV